MPSKSDIVSVIVPVYNTALYLPDCLDSVLNQTYPYFEIICIDDGSTDDSAKILSDFAKVDKRIHFYSQKNAGVSAARNFGIQKAKGKYICFLDSDDIYHPQFLEIMVRAITSLQADMVWCHLQSFTNGAEPPFPFFEKPKIIFEKNPFDCLLRNKDLPQSVTTNKLYRKDLISSTKFDKGISIAEDYYIWCYKICHQAKNGGYIPIALYYNRIRSNSATQVGDPKKWLDGHLKCIEILNDYYTNYSLPKSTKRLIKKRLTHLCLKQIIKKIASLDMDLKEKYQRIYADKVKILLKKGYISYGVINIKNKLKLWLFCHRRQKH
ncbi:MAG: glycosyltransferase family 2 protein [Alphaproteobacteria bacterium]|nr:glycosyltransferase family 2 protein [Alphaproteobacteria bacterium]